MVMGISVEMGFVSAKIATVQQQPAHMGIKSNQITNAVNNYKTSEKIKWNPRQALFHAHFLCFCCPGQCQY